MTDLAFWSTQIYFNALILVMNPENILYGIQYGQVEPDPDPTGPENPEKPGQDGEASPESRDFRMTYEKG